jgi:hypothetical protein
VTAGPIRTNIQDRYGVEIDDPAIEHTLDAAIPLGGVALGAAIDECRAHISFFKQA